MPGEMHITGFMRKLVADGADTGTAQDEIPLAGLRGQFIANVPVTKPVPYGGGIYFIMPREWIIGDDGQFYEILDDGSVATTPGITLTANDPDFELAARLQWRCVPGLFVLAGRTVKPSSWWFDAEAPGWSGNIDQLTPVPGVEQPGGTRGLVGFSPIWQVWEEGPPRLWRQYIAETDQWRGDPVTYLPDVSAEVTSEILSQVPQAVITEVADKVPAAVAKEISASSLTIPDLLNSWWAPPTAIYDAVADTVAVTGTSRGSELKVGLFELGLKRTRDIILGASPAKNPDDHYTPALSIVPTTGIPGVRPLVGWSFHGLTNEFQQRRGKSFGLDSLAAEQTVAPPGAEDISYGSYLRNPANPDDVVFAYRADVGAAGGIYFSRSSDGGQSWSGPYRLLGRPYFTWRLSLDGQTAYCINTNHPTTSPAPEPTVMGFKIALATGVVSTLNNTVISGVNLWTWSAAPPSAMLLAASLTEIIVSDATYSYRVYDIAPDGTAILMGRILRSEFSNLQNGEFIVRRLTAGVWSTEVIGPTGKPFGYNSSFYTAGGMFDHNANTAYLGQESGGIWRIYQWTCSAGVWTRGELFYTAPPGMKIGRVRVPQGAEGLRIIQFGEYTYYAPDVYEKFYGHAKCLDGRPPAVAPQTAVLASDSFNRADTSAATLGALDYAQGGTASGLSWTVTGEMQIVGNQVGGAVSTARWASVDLAVADAYVQIDITAAGGGISARFTSSGGGTSYELRYTSSGTVVLEKRIAGTTTVLWTSDVGAFTPGAGKTIGLHCKGTLLVVYINGVRTKLLVDTSIASGRWGLRSGPSGTFRLDNWIARASA